VGGTPYTFRVTVVNNGTVNALAAPGGHLLLFRGLLERARTPEELAGVLAHEIQHVLHRDGTRALLRHASTGLLLAALSGDPTGVMSYGLEAAHALASLTYSRQAETEADIGGLRLLAAAGVSPTGMLAFFEQLLAEEQRIPQGLRYASTHPAAAERLTRLRTLARELPSNPRPLLPDRNWEEVRAMCRDTRPPRTPFARP
jgi:predicted Zn-dependent protease